MAETLSVTLPPPDGSVWTREGVASMLGQEVELTCPLLRPSDSADALARLGVSGDVAEVGDVVIVRGSGLIVAAELREDGCVAVVIERVP